MAISFPNQWKQNIGIPVPRDFSKSIIHSVPVLLAIAGILVGLTQTVSAQVTVQVVNDSGLPDSNVFIKVPGKLWNGITAQPITPTNLFVDITSATPPNPTSLPLSTLPANGSIISSISGNTDTVYTFQADYINSGSIYFTYNLPFTFTNGIQPSPPPNGAGNAYRYDYAELSINDSDAGNNALDVTYVDKFGIPLQLEWFTGTNLVAGSYVYASTKTLVNRFVSAGLGQAAFSLGTGNITPGWQYSGPASYTNFARILAPQKVSGASSSVSPYPNIAYYLDSLIGSFNAFSLNGASPQAGYYYVGYQVSINTNATGWLVTMAQGPNPPPFNPALITGIQYTNTITFPIAIANASQYVYGAPVGPGLYSTNGILVTSTTSPAYAVETWMIGDVLSALNFGFWGGRYGTNSANWFSPVQWTSFPFGAARLPNDGYYNPYTALIYNDADPYGFAFSERITPDVLLSPTNGDVIRITILPDDRLDSPVVSVPATNMVSSNSITLHWTPVDGVGGYQVNVLRPLGITPVTLSASVTNYTLTGLLPGTPYVLSVQATGSGAGGNPIITPARPIAISTPGSPPANGGNFTQVQATFSAADPFYQLGQVLINGIQLLPTNNQWLTTNGVPARWIASTGTNQVIVTIIGTNNAVLFNDWLTFVLAQPFTVTNGPAVTTNSAISSTFLYGQKLSRPPPGVSGFLNGTTATNFLVSTQNISLVIGLTYVPAETRQSASVVTPAPSVTLSNPARLPGGGVQFGFDVPYGVPYNILATTNLLTGWQTIYNGIGQLGGESYLDPIVTGNGIRFYLIGF